MEACSYSDADRSCFCFLFVSEKKLAAGECLANIIHHLQSPIDVAICAPSYCNIIAAGGSFRGIK